MSDEASGNNHGVSRRDLLSGAAAALAAAAVTGTPARLLASTDDWRVDLTPPRLAGNGSMMGVPFEKHATVRIAIVAGPETRQLLVPGMSVEVTVTCNDQLPESGGVNVAKNGRFENHGVIS